MAFLGVIPTGEKLSLKLSDKEVEREAIGRSLLMIGGTVSLLGSAMIFSVNPAVKEEGQGIWQSLPGLIKEHKVLAVVGLGVVFAGVSTLMLRGKMLKRFGLSGHKHR